MLSWPRRSNQPGKSPIERSSTRTRAAPRQPMSPASVTTSDGSPSRATHHPWISPAPAAATSATRIASTIGTSCSCSAASTLADHAMTDATERSISPDTMTNVIVTTTITFSMCSWNRFTKLSTPR